MRPRRSRSAALVAVLALLAGCGSSSPSDAGTGKSPGAPDESSGAEAAQTVVYMLALHRKKDRDNASVPTGHGVVAVPLPDAEVSPDLTDSERITAAVDRLLAQQPHGHRDTLWAGECAPGESVSDVRATDRLVTVVLDGSVGQDCELDLAMTWLQSQQLAWTVVANSDLPKGVAVELVDGAGRTSERVTVARGLLVRRRT